MLPNMPTIGVRFDTTKMNAATHAADAWKAFWQAIDPATIAGALLFDGDVGGGAFCIAVQSMGGGVLEAIERAISASDECRNICAVPMFVKGDAIASEPLNSAGNIDAAGGLVGEGSVAHSALLAARPEKAASRPAPPPGARPASQLAKRFAKRATTIGSHAARAALSGGMLGAPAAASKGGAGAAAKKSSLGKTFLAIVVVIVVLALIALMIWGPKPGEAPDEKAAPAGNEASTSPAAEKADAPDGGASE